jgi:hypothetical protein
LALTFTIVMPVAPAVMSGTVMVLLVLALGVSRAALAAVASLVVLGAAGLIMGLPLDRLLKNAGTIWLLAGCMSGLLVWSRSLVLAVQTAVIVALLTTVGFYLVTQDPALLWVEELGQLAAGLQADGFEPQARFVLEQQQFAPLMTGVVAAAGWTYAVVLLLLGLGAYRLLPSAVAGPGDFSDLNLGRVLAIVLAVVAVAATFSQALWLVNLAIVMLLVFWLQGLALLHWLRSKDKLPVWLLVMAYVAIMMPVSAGIMIFGLGVMGYIDAWFDLRRRLAALPK